MASQKHPMSTPRSATAAVACRTASTCDVCVPRRSRWYFEADEAFLFHDCEASVHSTNQLACRHELLCLGARGVPAPAWHRRKMRTPRPHRDLAAPVPLVQDADGSDENDGVAERLSYRVLVFDPALAKFHPPPPLDETSQTDAVEILLAGSVGDDSFCVEALMDGRKSNTFLEDSKRASHITAEKETLRDTMDVYLRNCGSRTTVEDDEEEGTHARREAAMGVNARGEAERVLLRLDYEAIIAAWSSSGLSPWTSGERPQFRLDRCWPEHMGMWGVVWGEAEQPGIGDGKREAKVTRYREKRRTRLFSKEIRYEVRKLNAEKRPRMKGRFVKRASFAADATAASSY